jgi:uncharacterized protein
VAESWVINASPVILLAQAGLISHVPEIADPLVIPEPVAAEIRQSRTIDSAIAWLNQDGKPHISPPVPEIPELRQTRIGLGERAVISCVLDDAEARLFAHRLNVPLLGTVGVILKLKEFRLISEVKSYLMQIRKAGDYIGESLYRQALQCAGEEP